jgi:6-phosphogluconolactonase
VEAAVKRAWPGEVRVCAAEEEVAEAAADRVERVARAALARDGRFVIALSGGSTPRALYERLASAERRGRIAWERVHALFGDERWVPRDHADSNAKMAGTALLDRVPIPREQVHEIPTSAASPDAAAAEYDATVRALLAGATERPTGVDLLLLGMGADGHTASLFPGSPLLEERARLFGAARSTADGSTRVSATPAFVALAQSILVLVTGAAKAPRLAQVFSSERASSDVPLTLLRNVDAEITWICDEAAVSGARPFLSGRLA